MNRYEDLFGPRMFYRRLLGLAIFSTVVLLAPLVVDDPYYLELLFLCHYYVSLFSVRVAGEMKGSAQDAPVDLRPFWLPRTSQRRSASQHRHAQATPTDHPASTSVG